MTFTYPCTTPGPSAPCSKATSISFLYLQGYSMKMCVCVCVCVCVCIERERQVYMIFPPSISLLTQTEAAVHTVPHLNHICLKSADCKPVDV